jgi:SH3 domain-containing YSC84-like protein 1
MADKMMGKPVKDLIKKAKGVFTPEVLRGAFIVGVSRGSGVLVVRDPAAGQLNGSVFCTNNTSGQASFGLQAGADKSEVVLLVMSDRGVSALQSSSVKLGADVSVAVGPVGGGASAEAANVAADILTLTRAKGF